MVLYRGKKFVPFQNTLFYLKSTLYTFQSTLFSSFFVSHQLSLLAFTLFSQKRKSSLFFPVLYVYFASQPTKLTQHSFPLSFLSILSTSLLFSSLQPVAGNLQVSCMYSWVSPIHSHTHITFLSIFSTKQLWRIKKSCLFQIVVVGNDNIGVTFSSNVFLFLFSL